MQLSDGEGDFSSDSDTKLIKEDACDDDESSATTPQVSLSWPAYLRMCTKTNVSFCFYFCFLFIYIYISGLPIFVVKTNNLLFVSITDFLLLFLLFCQFVVFLVVSVDVFFYFDCGFVIDLFAVLFFGSVDAREVFFGPYVVAASYSAARHGMALWVYLYVYLIWVCVPKPQAILPFIPQEYHLLHGT